MGIMPEGFPVCNVGDVYFNHRSLHGLYGIADPHGGMGIGGGIQNDTVIGKACLLDFIDQFPLNIRLKIIELYSTEVMLQLSEVVLKGLVTVQFRLTFSKEVQIGPVDDDKFHGSKLGWLVTRSKVRSLNLIPYVPGR
jgi:hypothetical protein